MYEYKVDIYAVKNAEVEMNRMAKEGWRVVAVTPNIAMGHGIVVTFERSISSRA
ncbi:MAG: DUF4177 domain-containing protein [Lachnospiraceae bacterium]|nr:DUF4177 domain-containing protein [Lachnospiraceae bacterium]